MVPGLIAGVIVGGMGSRVAMRILAMTTPGVRGVQTDFGATIGQVTQGGTLFLLILGGILGMLGGIAYLIVRRLLPGTGWVRGLIFGVVLLALSGRLLVDPLNRDFAILSPAGLAVGMFASLPILYGLLFVPLAERLEPPIARIRNRALALTLVGIGLLPMMLLGGLGLVVVAGSLLVWGVMDSLRRRARQALFIGGYVLLGALVLWRGAAFISGVMDIL